MLCVFGGYKFASFTSLPAHSTLQLLAGSDTVSIPRRVRYGLV